MSSGKEIITYTFERCLARFQNCTNVRLGRSGRRCKHTSPFLLTHWKRFKISNSNLPEVEIFHCLGLIKEVLVCKKVLIEFLTKFILDNVWKQQKTFWICWQLEKVEGNKVQIIDSPPKKAISCLLKPNPKSPKTCWGISDGQKFSQWWTLLQIILSCPTQS